MVETTASRANFKPVQSTMLRCGQMNESFSYSLLFKIFPSLVCSCSHLEMITFISCRLVWPIDKVSRGISLGYFFK